VRATSLPCLDAQRAIWFKIGLVASGVLIRDQNNKGNLAVVTQTPWRTAAAVSNQILPG